MIDFTPRYKTVSDPRLMLSGAEPVRCTNAMALELGSFTTNSVSQNLLTAERSGTVREHLQIILTNKEGLT
jgi:hypothetical protein